MDKAKEKLLRDEERTRNPHTGDRLVSKVPSNKFKKNYDSIVWGTTKAGASVTNG